MTDTDGRTRRVIRQLASGGYATMDLELADELRVRATHLARLVTTDAAASPEAHAAAQSILALLADLD